ncbi:PAS domain S-box protein [Allosphingosinicella deserti]|nr:PAS domain S-box protein [Sphingomonas deserti]
MTSSPVPPVADPLSFLSDGGEMGARMRAFDWSATPLGPPERWPQALKTVVGLLLSTTFPMFVAWGPELRFLYNDGYIDVLDGKHPDALGGRFEEVWSELWRDVGPIAARAMNGESSYYENLPLTMTRQGSPQQTWFTFSYSPIRDENGAVAGMFCTCVDTTQMVLAQRERVNEAERLRRLFDQAPGFMAVLRGPEHIFELTNSSYQQLVGHRDLVGKPVREALPEVEGQGFFELLDEVYRSGKAYAGRSMLIALQREPGAPSETRLIDFVFAPILDAEGRTTGIFAEGHDATERHVAEQALRESEQRFRLIADSAPIPMWVTKLDRTRGFVNEAYAQFLGVPYDAALHFDWRARIHPEDVDRVVSESVAGEAERRPFELEARYRRADGAWRWLRSISQPRWGPDGEHVGFIGVATDITEAKEAEAALREVNETLEKRVTERTADLSTALNRLQAEVGERLKAEEALRQAQKMEAVGQLTGGIAHDFNNLLTPIMGGLELIATKIEDPRLKRIAEGALESSRRGAKLTSQLLAFSRIQRISMAPVAVNQVIANMLTLLGHTIGGAVAIRTDLDPEAGYALCDSNQLENAILNLAINARDAMPGGGTLTVSTRLDTLDKGPDHGAGAFVRVRVADTGHGMAPEVLARATEPFYSTKEVGKGTGLGLAQVYGIARQSGGTLRIGSRPGEGTQVDILLPAVAPADESLAPRAETQQRHGTGRRARILLVDDDPDVRTFLAESLRGLDHEVRTAESGAEALAILDHWIPEIALIDYAMPNMHGADLAAAARARLPDLPIVFVTGYAETELLEAALGPGAPVLRKPFSIEALALAVEDNLAPAPTAGRAKG